MAELMPSAVVFFCLFVWNSAWAAIGLYHILMVVIIAAMRGWPHVKSLCRGHFTCETLPLILGFPLLAPLCILILEPLPGCAQSVDRALASLGLSGFAWTLFVFYYVLINPWLEEVYWRGLLRGSHRLSGESFFFAVYHVIVLARLFSPSWPWMACSGLTGFVVILGVSLVWRRMARGGFLRYPALSHLAADASIVAIAYFVRLPA